MDRNLTVIAYWGDCGLFLSPNTRREIKNMSEPTNSGWPFSELTEAEGLDFDKVFSSGSSTTADDANPFDVNPFEEPQAEPSSSPVDPVPMTESAAISESTPDSKPAPAPAAEPTAQPEAPAPKPVQTAKVEPKPEPAEETLNPLTAAFSQKTVENAQKGLFEKPPVFCHKNAKEPIEDPSMTFEELRIRKSEDFADLEEGKNVSWSVEYCGIIKQIKDPKGTTIISMKESIERSREFLDALKKAKDKKPDCLVKPKVTMQKKGTAAPYKGHFASVEEARLSNKIICLFPGEDGKIYEMHKTEAGEFIAPKHKIADFDTVRAGFIPALPRIPLSVIGQLIAFFRFFMRDNEEYEAMAIINWDKLEKRFFAYVPKQEVAKEQIDADLTECPYDDETRYLRYADIHSHNSMEAFFSGIDDADERGTGLYMVLGCLDHFFPEIETRIACGGSFVRIDPNVVIEGLDKPYPSAWNGMVTCKKDKVVKSARRLLEGLRHEI